MPVERNIAPASYSKWYNDSTTSGLSIVKPDLDADLSSAAPEITSTTDYCPSCHMPFDKGKKRKLIDACGHERCYSCMFSSDQCPLCRMTTAATKVSKRSEVSGHVRQTSDPSGVLPQLTQARPKLKTNGHFTPFMRARHGRREFSPSRDDDYACREDLLPSTSVPAPAAAAKPSTTSATASAASKILQLPWSHRKLAINPSAFSDDEGTSSSEVSPPPPPAESARHDLFVRLGLLLGDRSGGNNHRRWSRPPKNPKKSNKKPAADNDDDDDDHETDDDVNKQRKLVKNNRLHQSSFTSLSSLTSSSDATNTSASNSTSPLSTLTASSEADRMMDSSGFRGSRDPSLDSMASLTSSTTGSASPMSTLPRRHSINTSGQVEDLPLFGKTRLSAHEHDLYRTTAVKTDPSQAVNQYMTSHIELKPLFFEVPQPEKANTFTGRQWLFREMEEILQSTRPNNRGIVLTGGIGSGKTSVILHLVDHSCFGRRKDEPLYSEICEGRLLTSGSRSSLSQSRWSLSQSSDRIRSLGSRIVAYHFCQADNNVTCLVPEFVHNLAAQLCQAPQLAAYRELLLGEPRHQAALGRAQCIADPSAALSKGILEPLNAIRQAGKIGNDVCCIVIDSLNEAEFHRPDYGDTIASFLSRHMQRFPAWLKVIVTVRTALKEVTKWLPFHQASLDDMNNSENLQSDLFDYVTQRINHSAELRANVTFNGKLESCATARFTSHLMHLSKGCFLYAKLTLDHVERGHLVMKSTSYKILPRNLSEAFLLHFNLRFPTTQSFQKAAVILSTCLASLYPLSLLEIFHTINAGQVGAYVTWDDFLQRIDSLAEFLVRRQDNTYMFFHPSFREWLVHRSDTDSPKFVCDARAGHANIAFRLSRLEAPLDRDRTSELGHHVLKANIFKTVSRQMGFLARDVQALWLCVSSKDVSAALVAQRNIYSPNVKVSRLLLLAGANPNQSTDCLNGAPALGIAAHEGFLDIVLMLLEFGADVNGVGLDGANVLCLGSSGGNLDIVKLLLSKGADLCHVDQENRCALVHAAHRGHIQVVTFLLQCDWSSGFDASMTRAKAAQQSLVAAASRGHTVVCEYLLTVPGVDINTTDQVSKDTALTGAASRGHKDTCLFLLRRGASVVTTNGSYLPPLLCAVRDGRTEIAGLLLQHQASDVDQVDGYGRTGLMVSASTGHSALAEMLLDRGASVTKADNEGLTALCWSCLKGHFSVVQLLLDRGSNIFHTDGAGRTPLNLAAFHGDPNVVQLLLDRGAPVEHVDHNGMRPLDRAIGCKNTAAVICFLKRGAKLGPATWAMASDKPDIMLILLSKLLEDGSVLYKKNRLKEAAYRYQYALKKFPSDTVGEEARPFQQLKVNLLLSLSRCRRKTNECESAANLATKALEIADCRSYEAYYARARAKRDLKLLQSAADDLTEAVKLAPENRELRRILQHVQDEIKENSLRGLPTTPAMQKQAKSNCGRDIVDVDMTLSGNDENLCINLLAAPPIV